MKAYELQNTSGIDGLRLVDKPLPQPGIREVLVRIRAVSLNYRDLLIVKGGYGSHQKLPLIPLSDGAGVVEAVVGREPIQDRRSGYRQLFRELDWGKSN